MLPAAVGPEATPLAGDAAAPGLSVAGLRLVDGSLVLKLERDGAALQFRHRVSPRVLPWSRPATLTRRSS